MTENGNNGQAQSNLASRRGYAWRFRVFILICLIAVVALGWVGVQIQREQYPTQVDSTLIAFATELSYTATASATTTIALPSSTATIAPTRPATYGTLIYSARMGGQTHIWAYVPGDPSPIQLTSGDWDDRDPAASPDGEFIAFSSNRDGPWDLYLLQLKTGHIQRLTDTLGFESHPTWSPDGLWLACETYYESDLNIWIIPVDGRQPPIQLTSHPADDTDPAWDPDGRRIAFISDRDGDPDVFVADLERPDERFHNLTNTPGFAEMNPTFSPDGFRLAYTVNSAGFDQILIQDFQELNSEPLYASQGREIAWSPDGQRLAAVIYDPSGTNVVTYSIGDISLVPLGLPLGSGISGLDWSGSGLPGEIFLNKYEATPSPLYEIVSNADATGRFVLVDLPSVSAPNPAMSDAVDEAFNALRVRTAEELGWDFLASLENAFVGVNDPLPPGYAYNDWLYTGRAFAFNHGAVTAGWVEVVREDYGGRTYWHVFVRTSVQDGSLGEPLRTLPWDFSVRRNGDSLTYDQGGSIRSQLPRGYYVDFTQLTADFGFKRLPALANWRTFYPSTRFNEFAYTGDLDWTSAMLELYPASAIVTPTPYHTPTPTPTRTLRPSLTPWWSWRISTPSPTSPPPPPPTSTP